MPRPRPCYPPPALLGLTLLLTTSAASAAPLTLDRAIESALEHANEMIQAREDVVLVDTEYMTALSAILPRIDITASGGEAFVGSVINEQRNPRQGQLISPDQPIEFRVGPFSDFQSNNFSQPSFAFAVTGRQLIYDGGRWWTVLARVEDVRAGRHATLERVRNEVRLRTTTRFYELAKASRALEVMGQQIDLDRAQLDRAKALVAAGRATSRDVAAAVRDLATDQITMEERRTAVRQASIALNLQLGRDPNVEVRPVLSKAVTVTATVALELPQTETLLDRALENRPEIAEMRATIEAAVKDVDVERADYFPAVTLEASYRKNSRRPDRVFLDPTGNYVAALDLVVRWNVFEGLGTKARVARARVALRKQLATLEDQIRRTRGDVFTSVERLRQLEQVYALSLKSVGAAAEAVRLARGLYEAGRGTTLERRNAEVQLTNARLRVIDARYEIEIGREELRRAIGIDPSEVRER